MKRKTWINKRVGRFWAEAGWFPGDEFRIFEITLGHLVEGDPGDIDLVELFGVRIAKAALTFGLDLEE